MKIGVGAIDLEHRQLSEAIDALHEVVGKQDQQSLTGPLLLNVLESTRAHFASEEAMMTSTKYPGAALHVLKHGYLLDQMQALVGRFSRGGFAITEHSMNFLRDWLITHIQKEDLQFALWLNEHGKY